jgi:hypothetical protein
MTTTPAPATAAAAAFKAIEMGDVEMATNVCNAYWDDIAEDYVDEAGRCLEAIVTTPPTLSMHKVIVDTVGVVGVRVNRPRCRDQTENPASPGSPSDIKLVVSFLRDGEVFAQTALSRPLGPKALADEASTKSEVSSLGSASLTENHEVTATALQVVSLWGDAVTGELQPITFDNYLEVSKEGNAASEIDVVVSLVDCGFGTDEFPTVPLAIGSVRVEGHSFEKRSISNVALHEPYPDQKLPVVKIRNPDFVAKVSAITAEGKEGLRKKKKRGLAKLLSGRKKSDEEEEEKKEDEGTFYPSTDPSPDPTFLGIMNDAYFLDPINGAFLRIKVEWQLKETNFEVNLEDQDVVETEDLRTNLRMENSIKLCSKAEDTPSNEMESSVEQIDSVELTNSVTRPDGIASEPPCSPKHARNDVNTSDAQDDETYSSHYIFDTVVKALSGASANEGAVEASLAETLPTISPAEGSAPPPSSDSADQTPREMENEQVTSTCSVNPVPEIVGDAPPSSEKENHLSVTELEEPILRQDGADSMAENSLLTDLEEGENVDQCSSDGLYAQLVFATSNILGNFDISEPSTGEAPHASLIEATVSVESIDKPIEIGEDGIPSFTNLLEKEGTKNPEKIGDSKLKGSAVPRGLTPSPADLSMERVLSWDNRRISQPPKKLLFAFGRRRRGMDSSSSSVVSAPGRGSSARKGLPSLPKEGAPLASKLHANQVDDMIVSTSTKGDATASQSSRGLSLKQDEVEPLSRKGSLKPPSSLPRIPREGAKYQREAKAHQPLRAEKVESLKVAKKTIQERDQSPSKPFGRKKWGRFGPKGNRRAKLAKSNSMNALVEKKAFPKQKRQSSASVFSDAETVEIENVAREAFAKSLIDSQSADREYDDDDDDDDDSSSEDDSVSLTSAPKAEYAAAREPQGAEKKEHDFSFMRMFGSFDVGKGPVKVDGKDVWLYAKDDDTIFTKDRRMRSDEDDLTMIPSPGDVLLSEAYHRCGPGKIADLGDAILEESRVFVQKTNDVFRRGSPALADSADEFGTFTFDEPTFDPSLLSRGRSEEMSALSKIVYLAQDTEAPRKESESPVTTPSKTALGEPEEHSPKGVSEFDETCRYSKIASFSEAFMNMISCHSKTREKEDKGDQKEIPGELIRNIGSTDPSVGDLTLTTHEMQVEIEQYKKKLEAVHDQAGVLDEHEAFLGEGNSVIFQPPSLVRRASSHSLYSF